MLFMKEQRAKVVAECTLKESAAINQILGRRVSILYVQFNIFRHGYHEGQNHDVPEKKKQPHIKKPLNAFMLFMKEQRPKVIAECTLKESAAINQILGRRVSIEFVLLIYRNCGLLTLKGSAVA